jgi:uncharacterized damage-inducible protein DinB
MTQVTVPNAVDVREFDSHHVEFVLDRFLKAAAQTPREKFDWKPTNSDIKSAQEILRHVVEGNHTLLHSLRELKPLAPLSEIERQRIRTETATPDLTIEALRKTGEQVAAQIRATPQERLSEALSARLLMGSIVHMAYHWGQLAYLQTMWGDSRDHS